MFIAKAPSLEVGKAYFMCGYYVRDLPIPEIETWIYIGSNIYEEDKKGKDRYHYFEKPESYLASTISEERKMYANGEEITEIIDNETNRKLRVKDSDIEAFVYDYKGLVEWVTALAEQPNAKKVL